MAKISSSWGRFSKDQAKEISDFFEKNFPGGALTAHDVLELARPKTSPLHEYFEWDDSVAAERYRLRQAQKLITCLVVEFDGGEPVRKYVPPVFIDETDTHKAYVEINTARANQDIWDQVTERAMNEAVRWRDRYNNLKAVEAIRRAITKTEEKLRKKNEEAGSKQK